MTDVRALTEALREYFDRGMTRQYRWRVAQLRALRRLIAENQESIAEALLIDLGKPSAEVAITETGPVIGEIDYALRHLRRWMHPRRVRLPLFLAPARARVVNEPLGLAAIIGPWNYPFNLAISPLVGAIAAGNTAIVKPSEVAAATSALIARLLPSYLDPRAFAVVEGGAETTTKLLEQRLDHIFFTGSEAVGRIVAQAAARNLTPVTLELGGKSPVFVDASVDLEATAGRIMWGKLLNAGQTCVAPDYLLATPATAKALVPLLERAAVKMYGPNPATNHDYGAIVNQRHTERLATLLQGHEVAFGGTVAVESRYVAPTVIDDVDPESQLMREEIFGPILPIVHVASDRDAVEFIASRPKPLAIYVFSRDRKMRRAFRTRTSSGALCFGLTTAHLSAPSLPFGGVGASGMGVYHGEHSFNTFSHARPVLDKPLRPDTVIAAYPPYGGPLLRLLLVMVRGGRRR